MISANHVASTYLDENCKEDKPCTSSIEDFIDQDDSVTLPSNKVCPFWQEIQPVN